MYIYILYIYILCIYICMYVNNIYDRRHIYDYIQKTLWSLFVDGVKPEIPGTH